MSRAGKFITANANKLAGFLEGQDAQHEIARNKLKVFTGKQFSADDLKGDETLKSEVLNRAKREFILKHIRTKPNGTHEFRIRDGGVNYSKSGKNLEKLVNDVMRNRYKPRGSQSETLNEFLTTYENLYWKGEYKEKTLLEHKNKLRHLREALGKKPLNKITSAQLQEFINNIDGSVIRKKIFNFTCEVFARAVALRKIKHDPTLAISLPYTQPKIKKTGLTYAQQCALVQHLEKCDLDFKKFIIASIVLGARKEETVEIKISDIDEKGYLHINGTKTINAPRSFKISEEMKNLLKRGVTGDKIFQCQANAYYKRLKRCYSKLGIIGKDMHSLRHTCSANLYWLGHTDKERQHILGHASITTTNDIYTSLEPEMSKEKVLKLYGALYS